MVELRAYFDGKVLVPDHPVDLPTGRALIVRVEPVPEPASEPASDVRSVLEWIVQNPIVDADLPDDLAEQHDHYLYGTPKKEVGE